MVSGVKKGGVVSRTGPVVIWIKHWLDVWMCGWEKSCRKRTAGETDSTCVLTFPHSDSFELLYQAPFRRPSVWLSHCGSFHPFQPSL